MQLISLIFPICCKNNKIYSQTSTYGHLSTTANFFCPQDGHCGQVRLQFNNYVNKGVTSVYKMTNHNSMHSKKVTAKLYKFKVKKQER